jgi:FtsH-binding integral membrane protein
MVFEISSISTMFFITAATFILMSLYGYLTDADLTGAGQIMLTGLVGIVIAGFVNIFMNNALLDLVISVIGVVVFTILIAYDT